MSAAGPSQGANCAPSGGVGAHATAAGPSQGANCAPSGGVGAHATAAGPPQGANCAPSGGEGAPRSAPAPRLAAQGVRVVVGSRTLVDDLALSLAPGRCCVIVGPNGAGKSTLLRTLAGLRSPAQGTIAYDGVNLDALGPRERARRRGWLPDATFDAFPATVLETVLVGRHPALQRWQWESGDDIAIARGALAGVGLPDIEQRDVGTLSSGERRRVGIAALLAQDPAIMLLDEPSAHLDPGQQVAVLDLVCNLARERGKVVAMVLHDLHLALRYADVAVAIARGRTLAGPASDILCARVLSDVFGHPLVEVGAGTTRTLVPA